MTKKVYTCEYKSTSSNDEETKYIATTDVVEFITKVREIKGSWDTVGSSIKTYAGTMREIPIDNVLNPIICEEE